MDKLEMNSVLTVCGIEVPNIVGGFGEDKKVMLAKTVAEMFGMEVRAVNQVMERNKEKFEKGIDVLGIKGTDFAITICDSGIIPFTSGKTHAFRRWMIASSDEGRLFAFSQVRLF